MVGKLATFSQRRKEMIYLFLQGLIVLIGGAVMLYIWKDFL